MNKKLIMTQFKREIWENKVSFIYTPIFVTLLILVIASCAALYSKGVINGNGMHFNFSSNNEHQEAGAIVDAQPPQSQLHGPDDKQARQHFDIQTVVSKDPSVFNGMVMGIMYANCALLYLVFSIVMSAYSLRCLFDDRKNKDILFWRSMPVSETVNVLVKVGMVLLVIPLIMLALNVIITLLVFLAGLILFGVKGIPFSDLISSVVHGGSLYIPFQIFYELLFSLLMSLPIIGFAFFSSAYAKKTPFFIFASPALLALLDKILNSLFGIDIGVIDLFAFYGRALAATSAAFTLREAFVFQANMIIPLIVCIVIGSLFFAGSIWLRNNRYEI